MDHPAHARTRSSRCLTSRASSDSRRRDRLRAVGRRREWRLLGALALSLGGSLALAGSILPWAVAHYSPRFLGIQIDRGGPITHPVHGIDLTQGQLTLAG